MGRYILRCFKCNKMLRDEYTNICDRHDALLRTEYSEKNLVLERLPGIWKFYRWLPVGRISSYKGCPITYRSNSLAKELGLRNLYISFSGYFPEKNCRMMTCTFKELEAPPTVQRAIEKNVKILVVASAGNTARAFASIVFSQLTLILVVPERYIDKLWLTKPAGDRVHLIAVEKKFDYHDAILFAERLGRLKGFISEGGARNIARRDGMGTVLLDAVLKMKRLPDHYFQAVGSGTGALSVWEAAARLIGDGKFGSQYPKLHLAQNSPFIPMVRAWLAGRRKIIPEKDMPDAYSSIRKIYADVLSNRNPAYSIAGGVYDALKETGGQMYSVTNREAKEAEKLFSECENIDIVPAASVAVAALIQAVRDNKVGQNDLILLNITGGGEKRLMEDCSPVYLKPEIKVKDIEQPLDEVREIVSL